MKIHRPRMTTEEYIQFIDYRQGMGKKEIRDFIKRHPDILEQKERTIEHLSKIVILEGVLGGILLLGILAEMIVIVGLLQ